MSGIVVTGIVDVDDALQEMVDADKGGDYEVAHAAQDAAKSMLISAFASGIARQAHALTFEAWMQDYRKADRPRWFA